MASAPLVATCTCGAVRVVVHGAPIATVICHCDDCQTAADQIEKQFGISGLLDGQGATSYLLAPKDRVEVVEGGEYLVAHKLRSESPTNRLITSCCNTPMMASFDRGPFWISLYRDRFGDDAPAPEMRVQTRHLPDGVTIPDDLPAHKAYPPRLALRLASAAAGMGLRKLFGTPGN